MTTMIQVENVAKSFTLHNQGGVNLPVFDEVNFEVAAGEALVLAGASGAGKSSLLRILYGNYRPTRGSIRITHAGRPVDIVSAVPRTVLDVRRRTLGFVSQFLRVIPRVSALDIVRDPLLARGATPETATEKARAMLARLNLPERLWSLAPATFSGGEQQRVNIARSFVDPSPIMLIDEPTASLDAANRDVVVALIAEARAAGSAIVGIFHDEAVREKVATRYLDITAFRKA
ncbi:MULTISPECIES: phosphonate C-P lyase system protein PhnL [unclassified Bosea (in: a-proteobacteria)]|uniref:phosphonate C-P lyase system protein PhnL n=1 Tax=unclassified Bosea (in: a-proteobacteria) TaxID=2653178 RepID=UPI0009562EFB|nr:MULTISPECIES: phosphonate C-P lyase system protein PhnL [unclassified Bosea (in: a-proteobacteria)]TAJ28774.1 MAG: phosphonate C-P lyase system protein PhnL [Bosea sp. (in: a-proteobacteria)]SIR25344.1 alpha-D-ribose 1-methylphosphonate 5-triphosphate synthase subunit PhnL [Bosea sp. TND4EK4]